MVSRHFLCQSQHALIGNSLCKSVPCDKVTDQDNRVSGCLPGFHRLYRSWRAEFCSNRIFLFRSVDLVVRLKVINEYLWIRLNEYFLNNQVLSGRHTFPKIVVFHHRDNIYCVLGMQISKT